MRGSPFRLTAAAISVLVAAGCMGGTTGVAPVNRKSPGSGARASASPGSPLVVPQARAPKVRLAGRARVIVGGAPAAGTGFVAEAKGAIISDNGGGIISNNGGTIVSNNGGGIISDNGGGLVGNNGAGYALAQAGAPASFALADAAITFEDAAGRPLVDEKGAPLRATTGRDGAYALAAALPPGNLVARIKLWNGGELLAMVVRDGADALTLDLDTASTMGAAYVLGRFVKGDQAIFDRLPRGEGERLVRTLDVVRAYVRGAVPYDAARLADAADALRTREPAVDRTLEDVKALLLGTGIGTGRLATEIPIGGPRGLQADGAGGLLFGESSNGRVRRLGPDGRLETIADMARGRARRSFVGLQDVAEAPDGSIYVAMPNAHAVLRIAPDGKVTTVAGTARPGRPAAIAGATETALVPWSLAIGPDGTLYIGEEEGRAADAETPPRVYALAPDGSFRREDVGAWGQGTVTSLAAGPDGALYALHVERNRTRGTVYRRAGGASAVIATDLFIQPDSELALGPDGTVYVAESGTKRVVAIAPGGGAPRAVLGAGGEPPEGGFASVEAVAVAPDGTLYAADHATGLIHMRPPGGATRVVAGTRQAIQAGDTTTFAINTPGGVAFDAEGRLLIADGAGHAIKRFDGRSLEVVAGGEAGFSGDGGPATQARLRAPTGLAFHDGTIWFVDSGNRRVRRVRPDGIIETRAGGDQDGTPLVPGSSVPALGAILRGVVGLAVGPDGRPYFSRGEAHDVLRLVPGPDGERLEVAVGAPPLDPADPLDLASLFLGSVEPDPARLNLSYPIGLAFEPTGDLLFTDVFDMRLRRLVGPGSAAPRVAQVAGLPIGELLARMANHPPGEPIPDGVGLPAREAGLLAPTGVAADAAGNIYLAEAGTRGMASLSSAVGANSPFDVDALPEAPARIRRIAPDGTLSTIAGPGGKFFGDPTAEDGLVFPSGLAVAPDGRLVIVDAGANLVRVLPAGSY